jgi:hypothetical protein
MEVEPYDLIVYHLNKLGIEVKENDPFRPEANQFNLDDDGRTGVKIESWNIPNVPKPDLEQLKIQYASEKNKIQELREKERVNKEINAHFIVPEVKDFVDVRRPRKGTLVMKGDALCIYNGKEWIIID